MKNLYIHPIHCNTGRPIYEWRLKATLSNFTIRYQPVLNAPKHIILQIEYNFSFGSILHSNYNKLYNISSKNLDLIIKIRNIKAKIMIDALRYERLKKRT